MGKNKTKEICFNREIVQRRCGIFFATEALGTPGLTTFVSTKLPCHFTGILHTGSISGAGNIIF